MTRWVKNLGFLKIGGKAQRLTICEFCANYIILFDFYNNNYEP